MTSIPPDFFPMSDERRAYLRKKQYDRHAPARADEADFFKTVKDHKLVVIKDDGVHRHLMLKQPGTMNCHFNLVTFPGYLCYTGDMGSFLFTRLEDMFEFFRTKNEEYMAEMGLKLYTNHSYWSEKLVASNCSGRHEGKATEFDEEKFKAVIIDDYLRRWIKSAREDGTLDKEERRELWEAVHDEIISQVDDYRDSIKTKVYEFSWKPSRGYGEKAPSFHFEDLFEHNFEDYTHSFRWACLAISWGIQQYDDWKDEKNKDLNLPRFTEVK